MKVILFIRGRGGGMRREEQEKKKKKRKIQERNEIFRFNRKIVT